MRGFLANACLTVTSIVVCTLLAELAVRIIDGQSPVMLLLPQVMASHGVDTTGGYLDKLPGVPSVDRRLFFRRGFVAPNGLGMTRGA